MEFDKYQDQIYRAITEGRMRTGGNMGREKRKEEEEKKGKEEGLVTSGGDSMLEKKEKEEKKIENENENADKEVDS